jgi:tight adherence protein B
VLALLLTAIGGPVLGLVAVAVPLATAAIISRKLRQQRTLFRDQLPDNLQIISSAMRAGHSFSGALSVVVEDAPEPTRRELTRVIADERLGVPLDEALEVMVHRMSSKDFAQVALVATLQRETGGNTAEVLDRVTDTVRERLALQRMIKTLTAQGRMSRWVVSALPVVLLAIITLINPEYMSPLYDEPIGRVLLAAAGAMVVAGSLVIKRIVDIKV